MKNFSTEIYEEALRKLTFLDYENFSCINEASSDLTSNFDVVNKVAPTKTIRVKGAIQLSILIESLRKKIVARDKLFKKILKSKLSMEEILYKETRNTVQDLIKDKKEKLCKKNYLKI